MSSHIRKNVWVRQIQSFYQLSKVFTLILIILGIGNLLKIKKSGLYLIVEWMLLVKRDQSTIAPLLKKYRN